MARTLKMLIYFPLLLASVLPVSAPASQSQLLDMAARPLLPCSASSLPTPPSCLRTRLQHQPPLRSSPSPLPSPSLPSSFPTMVKENTTLASILTTCVAQQPAPPSCIVSPTGAPPTASDTAAMRHHRITTTAMGYALPYTYFSMYNPRACGALDKDEQGCSPGGLLDIQICMVNERRLSVLHVPTVATVLGVLMVIVTAAVWQRKARRASGRSPEGISSTLPLLPLWAPSPSSQHRRHRQRQQQQQRQSPACRRSLWPSPSQSPSAPSLPTPSLRASSLPAPSLPAPSLPASSLPAPSLPAPSLPDPSLPDPSLPDPSLPAPSLPAPSLPDPSLRDPSLPAPSLPAPSLPDPSLPAPSLPAPSLPAPSLPAPSLPDPSLPDPSLPASSLPAPSLPDPSLPAPSLPAPSLPAPSLRDPSLPAPSLPAPSLPAPSLPAPSLPAPSLPAPSLPAPSLPATSLPAPSPVTSSPPALSLHSLSLPGPSLPTRLSQPSPPLPLPRSLPSSPPPPPCTPPTQLWTARGLLPPPCPLPPVTASTLRPPLPPPPGNIRRPAELLRGEDGEDEGRQFSGLGPIVDQPPRRRVSQGSGIQGPAGAPRSQEEKRNMAVWDEEMGGGYSCTARPLQPGTPERCPVAHLSDIQIGKEIAEGGCGKIFRGSWLGRDVAVKVPRSGSAMDRDEAKLKREIELEVAAMMAAPPHPNVLQLLAASLAGPSLALVVDYHAAGCLFGMLYGPQRPAHGLPCSVLLRILLGVARGMAWLHFHNVVHRDLKPENILMDTSASPKIADFGLAAVLQDRHQLLTGRMGSPGWVAPEILKGLPYNEKVDVYSFGIIIWECLAGKRPYEGLTNDQVMLAVAAGSRPAVPPDTDPALERLMSSCWDQDPEQRPAFHEITTELQLLLQQALAAEAEL